MPRPSIDSGRCLKRAAAGADVPLVLGKLSLVLLTILAVVSWASPAEAAEARLRVSPHGSDTGDGTGTHPLRTIGTALRKARPGQRIVVAPGSYPPVRDETARGRLTRVVSLRPLRATIEAVEIFGGQNLRFEGFRITAGVQVRDHPVRGLAQPARKVALVDSEVTHRSGGYCIIIRSGARAIRVARNRLHHCKAGVEGPGHASPSSDVTVVDNYIHHLTADGVRFGDWSRVLVARNLITHVDDPAGEEHNDGIQLMGNSRQVRIARNEIYESTGQLLFMKEDVGQIHDVEVESNVLAGTRGYAIQSAGVTKASFVANTVWGARWGGLLLRPGAGRPGAPDIPRDTVVVNNVLQSLVHYQGAESAVARGNVVSCTAQGVSAVPCVQDPGFVSQQRNDFRLRPDSPLHGSGVRYFPGVRSVTGERCQASSTPGAYCRTYLPRGAKHCSGARVEADGMAPRTRCGHLRSAVADWRRRIARLRRR